MHSTTRPECVATSRYSAFPRHIASLDRKAVTENYFGFHAPGDDASNQPARGRAQHAPSRLSCISPRRLPPKNAALGNLPRTSCEENNCWMRCTGHGSCVFRAPRNRLGRARSGLSKSGLVTCGFLAFPPGLVEGYEALRSLLRQRALIALNRFQSSVTFR
jgi:hypothetical protein